jgi:hypothetical protein
MARANQTWSEERIAAELLLKIGRLVLTPAGCNAAEPNGPPHVPADRAPRDCSSVSRTLPTVSMLQPEQHTEPLAHVGNDVGWSLRLERESPRLPIEVLDVIGEDNP